MGQINTNNYPTVDSLADADLLIVENAVHGTGTTTPKQLRENAIGTDTLNTTAQTVTGAINEVLEIAETGAGAGLELGKMTSFSDGVIVTDIDLHRAPVAGDRILFYHSTAVASPSSLTTYNDGVAVTTTIGDFSLTHPAGLTLMKCVALSESLRWQTVQDISYTAGTGISINGMTISNSAPQLGDDITYNRIDTVTSGALGYFSADADCLVMDFHTDAEPYNGGYTLRLTTTGASFKYAVLKDKAGNNYADEIPSGSLVLCKSNVSGTGSEADPVVVTVLGIGNVEMAHDVEVLKDICITEKTASGNPITLTDALPYAALSLSADIKADQDLHGYDKPWVGGAGKNKLITPDLATFKSLNTRGTWSGNEYTDRGVTCTVITDNDGNVIGINTNGTATGGLFDFLFTTDTRKTLDNYGLVVGNSYIFTSGLASDVSGVVMMLNGSAANIEASASGRTFTVNSTDTYSINIRVTNGTTANNVLFKPMIRLATESDATFAPYSNICPISGRTSVTITRTDAESQTADFTIQLGQTVYGGSVDFKTGLVTLTYEKKLCRDLTISYNSSYHTAYTFITNKKPEFNNYLCSEYKVVSKHYTNLVSGETSGFPDSNVINFRNDSFTSQADAIAKLSGVEVCYELATPIELTLTPVAVEMLKGYNQISSDGGGDITLTYKADRIAALEAALAALA